MKEISSLLFFFLLITCPVNAQDEKIRVQLGGVANTIPSMGKDVTTIGFNIGIEAFLSKRISINSSYTNYPKQQRHNGVYSKASTINLTGRYYYISKRISSYFLSGLTYEAGESIYTSHARSRTPEIIEYEYDWLLFSFGLGIRGRISDRASLFTQARGQIDLESIYFEPLSNVVLNAGLSYRLK